MKICILLPQENIFIGILVPFFGFCDFKLPRLPWSAFVQTAIQTFQFAKMWYVFSRKSTFEELSSLYSSFLPVMKWTIFSYFVLELFINNLSLWVWVHRANSSNLPHQMTNSVSPFTDPFVRPLVPLFLRLALSLFSGGCVRAFVGPEDPDWPWYLKGSRRRRRFRFLLSLFRTQTVHWIKRTMDPISPAPRRPFEVKPVRNPRWKTETQFSEIT